MLTRVTVLLFDLQASFIYKIQMKYHYRCVLYLWMLNLLKFQRRDDHENDDEVRGIRGHNGSW